MSVANKLQAITETSCLVNVMHEILVDQWNKGIPSTAICPTQRLESNVGFDVAIPDFEKLLVLQFKAYKRYRYKALDYFSIYKSQHNTLLKYPRNCAFYVFPDYKTHSQMVKDRILEYLGQRYKILNNTWFVDAHSIAPGTKRVLRNHLTAGNIANLRWRTLSRMIVNCEAGLRILKVRGQYRLLGPNEKEIEILETPRGTFSFFYTKTKGVRGKRQKVKVSFT
jgi:hypothetical protein